MLMEKRFYPLHLACFKGLVRVVRFFVESGGDGILHLRSAGDGENTPLHYAAMQVRLWGQRADLGAFQCMRMYCSPTTSTLQRRD